MRDKQVRRRRAVLALLVGASLILLSAYFGESPSSPLHSVQRGIVEVLSPVQAGASKVLTPVRDVAGWFSDTIRAKSRVDQLRHTNQRLQRELAVAQLKAIEFPQLAKALRLDQRIGLSGSQLTAATVISQDPQLFYDTIEIDKGSSDGVQKDAPVIGDGALVGKVTTVDPNVSFVTLITDHSFGVSAVVENRRGDRGTLGPQVGNPTEMLLQNLDPHQQIQDGQLVVTTGFKSGPLNSLYPGGIPIGEVSHFNANQLLNDFSVQVTPAADLRRLAVVQVLTHVQGGTQLAAVTKPPGASPAPTPGGTG